MLVETIKLKNGQLLKIHQDSDMESPRTAWDNLGKMICFHKRYDLGDKHKIDHNNFSSFDEMIEETVKDGEYLPLFLYDHGSITMKTSSFGCRWDSGQVGFIYISKNDIIKEFGNDSEETRKRVLNVLQCEVKTYDQYLTGDIYGFQLIEVKTCELGHQHEEVIDSCWGFYGSDHVSSGLYDHAGIKTQDVA
jgi:hypothetical protein